MLKFDYQKILLRCSCINPEKTETSVERKHFVHTVF